LNSPLRSSPQRPSPGNQSPSKSLKGGYSGIQNPIHKTSPVAFRRAASARVSSRLPPSPRSSGLARPLSLDKPEDLNPLRLHPTSIRNQPHHSLVRAHPKYGEVKLQDSRRRAPVETKGQKRITSTHNNTLESRQLDEPELGPRLQRRGTGKVLDRVANAWDRLHARSTDQGLDG
jgi:hypothetical protein